MDCRLTQQILSVAPEEKQRETAIARLAQALSRCIFGVHTGRVSSKSVIMRAMQILYLDLGGHSWNMQRLGALFALRYCVF